MSSHEFNFTTSRHVDPEFAGKQHIESLRRVRIQVERENGTTLNLKKMTFTQSWRVSFSLPQDVQYHPEGERMVFRIAAEDAHVTRTVIVRATARRR
jgi:hypothetical protein